MQTDLFFMPTAKTKLSPLERLKKASNLTLEKKVVQLADGEDFEFWSSPMTMAEREQAQKGTKDDLNAFALRLFVQKATDENGQRLFAAGHTAELKNEVRDADLQSLMLAVIEDDKEESDPKG